MAKNQKAEKAEKEKTQKSAGQKQTALTNGETQKPSSEAAAQKSEQPPNELSAAGKGGKIVNEDADKKPTIEEESITPYVDKVFATQGHLICLNSKGGYVDNLSGAYSVERHTAVTQAALPNCAWSGCSPLPKDQWKPHLFFKGGKVQQLPAAKPVVQDQFKIQELPPPPSKEEDKGRIAARVMGTLAGFWRKPPLMSEVVAVVQSLKLPFATERDDAGVFFTVDYHGTKIRVPESGSITVQ